ncbi:hypothetical protein CV102_13685 [Natronococcus pandeyae]|uniref:DUF8173 domain-containing protein n=1 Tax=Natronococcus pandeyae TaxID=2055836 RepID=A0A8J8TS77_9EURY|nr:hypothetical protein [Natronococcus pandeyae]TYL38242.1 hypothetical protein CV102_13685 [Natronococcus pandeyae]
MIDGIFLGAEVVLQNGVDVDTGLDGPSSLVSGAIGAFLTTLIIGAILVAVSPEYTERMVEDVPQDPLASFLYGFLALILLALAIAVLVLTIVGILVAIPLVIVAYLAWAVGATIALLAIGVRLVGREDGWTKPLLVAAAINGGLALTGVGGLVSFVIGAVGFGAVLRGVFG